jgi:hypothetical protein
MNVGFWQGWPHGPLGELEGSWLIPFLNGSCGGLNRQQKGFGNLTRPAPLWTCKR